MFLFFIDPFIEPQSTDAAGCVRAVALVLLAGAIIHWGNTAILELPRGRTSPLLDYTLSSQ